MPNGTDCSLVPVERSAADPALEPTRTLMSLLSGAWVAQSIFVVAKLGIADFVDRGVVSLIDLGAATGTHAPSLFRVMRALVSIGIFTEVNGVYGMTPLADRLRRNVPGSLRAYAIMNGEQWVWRSWGDIEGSVRTGRPAFNQIFGEPLFDYYHSHPEAGRVSAAALSSLSNAENAAIVAACDFPASGTVVDVGGGRGSLLAAILKANPALRGVLLERPGMVDMARTDLEADLVAERCEIVAGDFFTGIPAGGDVYLLKKVIHDWNDDEARTILARCRDAMPKNARLLLAESVVPDGNRGSPAKWLDLLMLVYTGGRERTTTEYRDLLVSVGFAGVRLVATASNIAVVEARLN
jgi:hypothetical protein